MLVVHANNQPVLTANIIAVHKVVLSQVRVVGFPHPNDPPALSSTTGSSRKVPGR
jgi:hypothetical protein